jgi:bifunctional DNA-binding transcriptional regulator/antitoxin component of YhaV-PrlF toxin-antitoxin module
MAARWLAATQRVYYENTNGRGASVTVDYVMKVSSSGQGSIPAEARARWNADQVIVVDLGDRLVLRPHPHEPLSELRREVPTRGEQQSNPTAVED